MRLDAEASGNHPDLVHCTSQPKTRQLLLPVGGTCEASGLRVTLQTCESVTQDACSRWCMLHDVKSPLEAYEARRGAAWWWSTPGGGRR